MSASPTPPPVPRSGLLTAFAWVVIVVSTLGLPISVITAFMFIAGSYGTQHAEPLGTFTVLCGPTLTLAAGIGLLWRQRWAWWIVVCALGAIVVSNAWTIFKVETGPDHYVSSTGVPTTVLQSGGLHLAPIIVVSGLALTFLLTRRIRMECRVQLQPPVRAGLAPAAVPDTARHWRVGHAGRDRMYYEEELDGAWQRIELSGEMLMGRAHHVIYYRSPERWQEYPAWARERRDEIIARIKGEFREPDYEYSADASTAAAAAPPAAGPRPAQGRGALLLVIVILLTLAAGLGWLVRSGLEKDETWLPVKRASQSRIVSRAQEPAFFWTAIGLYTVLGVSSLGLAAWLGKEGLQLARK